jgi:hypothetical protein
MSEGELAKISAKTAKEVCGRFKPGEAAAKLLRDDMTPGHFLGLLIENKQYLDAVRFLAYGLPKREAVGWACLCIRQTLGAETHGQVPPVLQAAENWVADPNDENRRAAMAVAEKEGFSTAAGCAALAAFLSGGSLTPPNLEAVPPAEHLTAQMVAGAVMLAAVSVEPEKAPEKYGRFLAQGMEVASGKPPSGGSA